MNITSFIDMRCTTQFSDESKIDWVNRKTNMLLDTFRNWAHTAATYQSMHRLSSLIDIVQKLHVEGFI